MTPVKYYTSSTTLQLVWLSQSATDLQLKPTATLITGNSTHPTMEEEANQSMQQSLKQHLNTTTSCTGHVHVRVTGQINFPCTCRKQTTEILICTAFLKRPLYYWRWRTAMETILCSSRHDVHVMSQVFIRM